MKALSQHKSSLSGSFRQVSRVGLTLQLRGTAPSDEDGLILLRASNLLDAPRGSASGTRTHDDMNGLEVGNPDKYGLEQLALNPVAVEKLISAKIAKMKLRQDAI